MSGDGQECDMESGNKKTEQLRLQLGRLRPKGAADVEVVTGSTIFSVTEPFAALTERGCKNKHEDPRVSR